MAVAVKNSPEVGSSGSVFDRPSVVSLVGVVYVLGAFGILFKLIPWAWSQGWNAVAGPGSLPFVGNSLLGLVMMVAAVGLIVVGGRMLGPKAAPGTRAGIFTGLVGVLVIVLLTRWASLWFEHWVYDTHWFSPTVGIVLTVVWFALLLVLSARIFLRPGFERAMARFEGQGWFSATPYKPLQGLRVRRGTIFGLLILVVAGVYTLIAHGTVKNASWQLNIPFTSRVVVESAGETGADVQPGEVVSRLQFDEINQKANPANFVRVKLPGESNLPANKVVPRSQFEEERKRLEGEGVTGAGLPTEDTKDPPHPADGRVEYATLTLLPSLQFTLPLLLLAGCLWLSWRVVNMPVFADFLIATEAEMNKVSWTTQRRLMQDTVVVLVTVFLMAVFLFSMDQVWRVLLSWKPIGVIQVQQDTTEQNKNLEQKPY